ncbi:MAG: C2H2-type zinc finger protein [Candidatus Nanohaloarchaea archaeon]
MVVIGVYSTVTFWQELYLFIKAGIGPLLILVGAFIVWLESDEWKMRREQGADRGLQQQFESAAQETRTSAQDVKEEVTTQDNMQEGTEGYTCPECGKTFDTERGMHIHQAQKHE